jgi:hypothetical protein
VSGVTVLRCEFPVQHFGSGWLDIGGDVGKVQV